MSKTKIFGEEHFIDNGMFELIEARNKAMDNIVFNEMEKSIKITLPFVKVNAEKLRNWVLLCMELENIDKSDLIECAVKKKFVDKDNENLKLKVELAEKDEQLKNAIVPNFKVGQEVWYINSNKDVISGVVYNIRYDSDYGFSYFIPNLQLETFRIEEINLYATPEQAEETLKKLVG